MPEAPPLAWPAPPVPGPPAPPDPPPRGPWAALALIGGAAVVVALVVTLLSVTSDDETPAALGDRAPGSATTEGVGARPSTSGPGAPPPVATVPPPTTVPVPTTGWPVDLSLAELEAALLTEGDLAMTEDVGQPPDTTDTIPVQDLTAEVSCQEMLRRYDAIGFRPLFGGGLPRAPRRATVELTGAGGTVEHEVDDGLQVTVADIRTLFETCTEIGFTRGSQTGSLVIGPGPPLSVGDDSLSLEYTFAGSGPGPLPVRWVIWERDSIISSVSVSGGDASAQQVLVDAVDIADLRLEAVIG